MFATKQNHNKLKSKSYQCGPYRTFSITLYIVLSVSVSVVYTAIVQSGSPNTALALPFDIHNVNDWGIDGEEEDLGKSFLT